MLGNLEYSLEECFNKRFFNRNKLFLKKILLLKNEDFALDLGGGTGILAELLAKYCKKFYVLDPDQKKIRFGSMRYKNVEFVLGKTEENRFPDNFFDKVLVNLSFHHIENQDASLREITRILKPSGLLVIHEIDPNSYTGKFVNWFENKLKKCGCNFYLPPKLEEKVEGYDFRVIKTFAAPQGYWIAARNTKK